MREIKFRAWDTKKQMMSGWPLALPLVRELDKVLTFNLETKDVTASKELIPYLMEKDANTGQWKGTPTSRYITMQYTGLKDKHGREIFEGDIVRVFSISDGEQIGKVVFEDGCFWVENKETGGLLYVPLTREIIGNIHENPELLK